MDAQIGRHPSDALLMHGGKPLVIGHRGASWDAPENTLEAFGACWAGGVAWVETDVQPTADLVPVLFHDDTLDRTTNGSGPLRSRTLAEVRRLDAGSWFNAGPRSVSLFRDATVPTLAALLATLPTRGGILLELKGSFTSAELASVLDVLAAAPNADQVFLQAFEDETLRLLRSASPGCWFGLLREEIDPDPVSLCRDLGAASYHVEFDALLRAPGLVADLHAAGVSVLTFSPNTEDAWSRLTDLHVDGIMTDRPAELRAWQLD